MRDIHIVANIKSLIEDPKIYRIYIDDDLITERTFIWDTQTHISENIFVSLDQGEHSIKVQSIELDADMEKTENFRILKLLVDGQPITTCGKTSGVFNIN